MTRPEPHELGTSELLPADVLLSLGASDLSLGIRGLDGGRYSHGSLWTGSGVIEATLPYVREVPLGDLVQRSQSVDVYRARVRPETTAAIVNAARGYLERPYGAVNLGICTLSTALASLAPGDWSKLNLMLGLGGVGKLVGTLTRLTSRVTMALSVTCVELVGRAYADAGVPLGVRLDTPGEFEPEAFLRALREVISRLPDDIRGHSDADWLAASVESRAFDQPGSDDWVPAAREWQEFLAGETARERNEQRAPLPARAEKVRPQRLQAPAAQIRRMELRAGVDWPPALLTPRLLQTSPSLTLVGRVTSG